MNKKKNVFKLGFNSIITLIYLISRFFQIIFLSITGAICHVCLSNLYLSRLAKQHRGFAIIIDVACRRLVVVWLETNLRQKLLIRTNNNSYSHGLRFAIIIFKRFYSDAWLSEDLARTGPHKNAEISCERMKCFRKLFFSDDEKTKMWDIGKNSFDSMETIEILKFANLSLDQPDL